MHNILFDAEKLLYHNLWRVPYWHENSKVMAVKGLMALPELTIYCKMHAYM
jgi:hypothetical protein